MRVSPAHSQLARAGAALRRVTVNTVLEIKDLRVDFPSRELGGRMKRAVGGLNLTVQSGEVLGWVPMPPADSAVLSLPANS